MQAASRNNQAPRIATVGIEVIQPDGAPATTYLFPARGPKNRPQLPFQLTAYGADQALANAPEVAAAFRALGDAAAKMRPFARTGSGQVFHGEWRPVATLRPLLDAVLPPAAS
ncbi:hypothetical protein [Streptomyces sp. NPDC057557]|uniref:hypothetical protein n=1 Tax=Streptomyces sp. NPDC057557 TaxID=3346167 RepID=UPI0036D18FFE